jgi:hypothetical protein
MTLGWIYALRDRGYEVGTKIGRDKNHPDRFRRAQCYTPRGIDLEAVWRVERKFDSLAQAEVVARRGLPLISGSNSGAEWCAVTATEAIGRVSANLGIEPEACGGNPRITTTYDDFRDPKQLGRETHRQILWIYRENGTGMLKVQRTCSWAVPQEPVKTYSLLGFRPVACFGLFGDLDMREGNRRIHELWVEIVSRYGYGVDHLQVGWLQPRADVEELRRLTVGRGLVELTDWRHCPAGVRSGY